ncbi:NAD(P)H-dependent oxidoreductase [Jeotgalibaca caeni]|uniref:NAD(P)H-dependent oxidoreductase n=1 Tax=Jeotgalibaca caeni TaxID=3028623 RepID=UPI00237E8A7E|nr:NAD(P)H-dependent oxidoreductase [Jeotgalibaca caeni]MDE1547622.1 NAD(P)H-dependent oxidoreductase [Jeotgalibaca caeni]
MKTLIIISHPYLQESQTQQFLRESLPDHDVTWHHLEEYYPDGNIDLQKEQSLLSQHDRILFQFPLYWYSSPPILKHWQDVVLTEGFAYGKNGTSLTGKEFGIVVATGVHEYEYQPGARENYTMAELMRPFQAMAQKCRMTYLPLFVISRFEYMNETQRKTLLIQYRQYLTKENRSSLAIREQWFKQELLHLGKKDLAETDQQLVDLMIQQMEENRERLDDLLWTLEEMEE